MRLSKLRGAADAAASRLEAVRGAVDRQQRAWDAALVRRAEAEDVLAGVDRTLVPEGRLPSMHLRTNELSVTPHPGRRT